MPIISVFFGIVVRMFYKEHEPPHLADLHRGELEQNWEKMKAGRPLDRIQPLE